MTHEKDAPKGPEVKAQELGKWRSGHYSSEMIGAMVKEAFTLGQKSKAATLKLPEKKPCLDLNAFANSELAIIHNARAEAYNAALDAVKSMNEGSGE